MPAISSSAREIMQWFLVVGVVGGLLVMNAYADQPVELPAEKPWVALVHDAGLAGGPDNGLVFALWRDGTLVQQQSPTSRASGRFRIGRVRASAIEAVEREISASGLWSRKSGPRYLDLPQDGLVIRDGARVKCWFDVPPTSTTEGVAHVAGTILGLQPTPDVSVVISHERWLAWSHYREKACE